MADEQRHDPTHGQIDFDIQDAVEEMNPVSVGQRVAIERTLQDRRNGGEIVLGVVPPQPPAVDPINHPPHCTPQRIQLSRRKGWRKPEGAVVVSRPSIFGNPFTVNMAIELTYARDETEARQVVVDAFRSWFRKGKHSPWWFDAGAHHYNRIIDHLDELRGRDLACWCPLDQPCHADVLLEVANR